jgi:hypothetical protein
VIATLIKKTIIRARSNRGQPPLFGPDLESVSAADRTVIPSGIAIALFALFGTMSVAKHGFERKGEERR